MRNIRLDIPWWIVAEEREGQAIICLAVWSQRSRIPKTKYNEAVLKLIKGLLFEFSNI